MTRSAGQLPNDVDTTHTHWKSDIIDPQTREAAEFDAGGVQQVRLLKAHVAHDDFADVNDPVDLGFDLSAGTTVLRAFAIVTEAFPNDVDLTIAIVPAGDLTNDYALIKYTNTDSGSGNLRVMANPLNGTGTNVEPPYESGVLGFPGGRIGRADGACKMTCYIDFNSPPAAGEADIYALIAQPA
jgi:hypothetical protein